MKYIITEEQLSKFIRKYLDSLELDISRGKDGSIWIEDGKNKEIFNYYIETNKTNLLIDPDIWSTVKNMFGLENMTAKYEIMIWFEDKFERKVDEVSIWWK